MNTWQYLQVWCYLNKMINMIMLIIYNELIMINHPIHKKSLYYTYSYTSYKTSLFDRVTYQQFHPNDI